MNIFQKLYLRIQDYFSKECRGNLKPGTGRDFYTIPDPNGTISKVIQAGYIISFGRQPCLKCKSRKLKLEKNFKGSERFSKAECKKCGFKFVIEVGNQQ